MDDASYNLLTLTKHTRENIQLNNQVSFIGGCKQRYQINNRIGHLQLFPQKTTRSVKLPQIIPLRIESHSGCIRVGNLFFHHRLKRFLANENLADLSHELRLAVIEAALEHELSLFEQMLGVPIVITNDHKSQESITNELTVLFCLTWERDSFPLEGSLSFNQQLLPLFLKAFEKFPNCKYSNWELLPEKVCFQIGYTQLSMKTLQDIAMGDVIFLDYCPLIQENMVVITIASSFSLQAHVKEDLIVVNGKSRKIQVNENKPPLVDIENLPINLVFEVGEREISLSELKTLQSGYTFTLDTPLDKPVTIRANGHSIGTGELIEINNHIGVRVLEFHRKFHG